MGADREVLEKRWSHTLTQVQRNTWNVFATFCPDYDSIRLDNNRSGKEMFVLCNLPKRK